MTTTTNLGLSTYDLSSGSATTFQTFRLAVAGTSSNMSILDTFAGNTSASLTSFTSRVFTNVVFSQSSSNYYTASSGTITGYVTNMIINATFNIGITGATTVNINAYGIITLKKFNSSGVLVDMETGDLIAGKYYLFTYNGTYFVIMNSGAYSGSNVITVSGSVISHNISGTTSGSYNQFNVDIWGHVTSASYVSVPGNISGSSIMSSSTGSIVKHNTSGIVSGSYNQILVDAWGHVTAGSIVVSSGSGSSSISGSSVMSDTTGSIVKHNVSGITSGSYNQVQVDIFGHITAGSVVASSVVGSDASIQFVIGDGINAITSGSKGFAEVPTNMTLQSWRVVGDSTGNIVVNVWKSSYAAFPPTISGSISGSATQITLATQQKNENTTLVNWSKSLTKGDWLSYYVSSASIVRQVTVSLNGIKA